MVFFQKIDSSLYIISNNGVLAKYNPQNQQWNYEYCFASFGTINSNRLYKLDNYLAISGGDGLFIADSIGQWTISTLNGVPLDDFGDPIAPRNLVSINGVWFGNTGRYGVYFSNNHGNNWQQLQNGVQPFYARGGLTVLNNVLFAGSYYNSIWRRTGPLEIITGNVYHDSNNNGVKDNGESGIPNLIVQTLPSSMNGATDLLGNYALYVDAIGDTLSVVPPTNFCSSNPSHYITNGAATNQNFGIQTIPNIYDLSVDITNVNVFRPGFQTEINMTVKNKGSVSTPATVKLILDSVEQFISAVPPPNFQSGDSLLWLMYTLDFLESHVISVITKTSVTAVLSDTVHCFASVTPVLIDTIPADNYAELHEIIVGSYDPNDKTCSFGNYFTPDQLATNEELSYVIRFQNTGNFQADFVHIKDTLSNYFDLSTFRIISSSHLMYFTLSGTGIVDFYFDNIFLPPSSSDELNSHGYVKYGVKCKESVMLGNAMVNTAYIYFDFNTAIITNTTTTLVAYPVIFVTHIPVNQIQYNAILVYPNPANEILKIDLRGINQDNLRLMIFDVTGSLMKNEIIQKAAINNIEVTNLPEGIYFGNVMSNDQKIGSFKFVISK